MKKLFLLMLLPLAMSIVSCETDDDSSEEGGGITPNNPKDVSVTSSADVQSYHSVVLKGYANGANGKVGFCYSATDADPNPDTCPYVETSTINSDQSYELTVDNLKPNTKYYYRAFATKDLMMVLAKEVKTFTTNDYRLELIDAEDITFGSVVLKGQAEDNEFSVGFCISDTVDDPTLDNAKVVPAEIQSDNSFSVAVSGLKQTTIYYYRAYARNKDVILLSKDIKKFTTEERKVNSNGHDYVDLGLPSGLLWATCNVGATKPEEYGDYFAWGETEPYYTEGHAQDNPCENWKSDKSGYNWSNYKWCNGSFCSQTKYCTSSTYGKVDNKTVLDAADDAAAANWGGSWRMPTTEEQQELLNNCTWTWTSKNGVIGYNVVGPNGYSIFLPAAGYRLDSYLILAGSLGCYWSSSLSTSDSNFAYGLNFNSDSYGYGYRYFGRSVRPVCQ